MNPEYVRIIASRDDDRRALFAATARRIGTTEQNIEKDFWVCWTLEALFHGLPPNGPRLLFKGGTSLSNASELIDRFSEDIDITVFRSDIGEPAPLEELEALSGKKPPGPPGCDERGVPPVHRQPASPATRGLDVVAEIDDRCASVAKPLARC